MLVRTLYSFFWLLYSKRIFMQFSLPGFIKSLKGWEKFYHIACECFTFDILCKLHYINFNCSMGFQTVKFSLTILIFCSDMPYLPCSDNSSRGVFVTCRVVHGPCLCGHWHCALVGNAGNLHFSNIEMSDDRAGLHYVCIVQNTRLRSLMQGDDQKIEPTPRPGTAAAWFHCPTYSQWWRRLVLFRPLQVLDHHRFDGSASLYGTELFNLPLFLHLFNFLRVSFENVHVRIILM